MTEPIHVRARKFLQEFFNDEDLTTLCFDYFPQVYNDFSQGMPKSQKVRMLVENNQRRGRFDELLAALERERPKSYLDHFAEEPHLIDPEPQTPKTIERNPRQIFISHAHQDAEFAQRLAADLQANGWQTWIAPDNIRPGEKWVEAINRGLSESGVFVLVLTLEAVASRWVESEMNVAIRLEHRGELQLLPLNVRQTDVPPLWETYQQIPFQEKYRNGLKVLLDTLELKELGKNKLERQIQITELRYRSSERLGKNADDQKPIQRFNKLDNPRSGFVRLIRIVPSRVWILGIAVILFSVILGKILSNKNTDPLMEPTSTVTIILEPTSILEATFMTESFSTCSNEENNHIVEEGDTLFGIARLYDMSVSELMGINGLTGHTLIVGQVIKIASCTLCTGKEQTYVVQSGDTFFGIGSKYGITYEELAAYNNLDNSSVPKIGQVLLIPCK